MSSLDRNSSLRGFTPVAMSQNNRSGESSNGFTETVAKTGHPRLRLALGGNGQSHHLDLPEVIEHDLTLGRPI